MFMPFPQMTARFYNIEKSMISIDKSNDTESAKDISINGRAIMVNLHHNDTINKIRARRFSHGCKQYAT